MQAMIRRTLRSPRHAPSGPAAILSSPADGGRKVHETPSSSAPQAVGPPAVRWLWTLVLIWGLALSPAAGATDTQDPEAEGLSAAERLEILLNRVEEQRASLQTLRATFRERKESPLLLQPAEAQGEFLFATPDRARWTLDLPQEASADSAAPAEDAAGTVIIVRDQEMLTWHRHLGRAERLKLGSRGERMLQFFGPGSSLDALRKYFTVRFTRSSDRTIPYRLELLPRSRRVARRVRHLTLDIDREVFLPVHVRFEEASGGVTEYWFSDLQRNVEIPASAFDVTLPADVEVREVEMGRGGQ